MRFVWLALPLLLSPQSALAQLDVTAGEVVDRETLKLFVEDVADWFEEAEPSSTEDEWKAVMREEGSPFKSGEIYLFIVMPDGYVVFHGGNASLEGTLDRIARPFLAEIVEAAQSGGGFVEYSFDDPTVEGDEEEGTPKLSYAVSVSSGLVIGSGIYIRESPGNED